MCKSRPVREDMGVCDRCVSLFLLWVTDTREHGLPVPEGQRPHLFYSLLYPSLNWAMASVQCTFLTLAFRRSEGMRHSDRTQA